MQFFKRLGTLFQSKVLNTDVKPQTPAQNISYDLGKRAASLTASPFPALEEKYFEESESRATLRADCKIAISQGEFDLNQFQDGHASVKGIKYDIEDNDFLDLLNARIQYLQNRNPHMTIEVI